MATHITMKEFEEKVLKSDKPVIVDFYAAWCGPCKMLAPTIDKISEADNGIEVFKVNVDQETGLAQKYGVMSIPTIIGFKDGKVNKQAVGYVPENKLLDLVK